MLNAKNQDNRPAPSINELVRIKNGHAVTTSRKVAKAFGKNHAHVLRDIKSLGCSEEFRESNFGLSQYKQKMPTGGYKNVPEYEITKDGFVILVMGYTGDRAMQFKEAYIKKFNEMEAMLRNEFLPPISSGSFAGLIPLQVQGRQLLCYTDVLRHIGRSTRSGSVQKRRKVYGNHFFKLFNRNFVTIEFADQLRQQKLLADNARKLQLSLPFTEGGSHA